MDDEGDKYTGGPGTETRTPAHGSSQIVYLMMRFYIDHVESPATPAGYTSPGPCSGVGDIMSTAAYQAFDPRFKVSDYAWTRT